MFFSGILNDKIVYWLIVCRFAPPVNSDLVNRIQLWTLLSAPFARIDSVMSRQTMKSWHHVDMFTMANVYQDGWRAGKPCLWGIDFYFYILYIFLLYENCKSLYGYEIGFKCENSWQKSIIHDAFLVNSFNGFLYILPERIFFLFFFRFHYRYNRNLLIVYPVSPPISLVSI